MYRHRAARPEDFPVIAAFPQNERELFYMFPKGVYPLAAAQLEEAASQRVNPTVVTRDGQIAGYCNLYGVTSEECWLGNVIVAPPFRGRGAADYMIRTMIAYAKEQLKVGCLRLVCHNENTAALLLYMRLGFAPFGLKRMDGPGGGSIAGIELELRLQPHIE